MTLSSVKQAGDVCRERLRLDIEWVAYDQGTRWVARDPLSGAFYYFGELEKAAAKLVDGRRSIADITKTLKENFPTCDVSEKWLQSFLGKLSRAYLLIPSQGVQNFEHRRAAPSWLLQLVLSPLSFRLPIWRPRFFSVGFRAIAKLLFSPLLVLALTLAIPVCLFLFLHSVLSNPDAAIYDLQRIQGDRWIWMLITYLIVKSLHELGHVLACARWGADCKEIGFLFLFFAPCLYCDTTDSWKLSSRWQRASIAAAGIYVELWIACFACVIWVFTPEGLEHTLAASTMVMCSVGTILINGNPCFRYDGYYILSDVWRVPNLSQQSSTALWMWFLHFLGGRKPDSGEFDKDYRVLAGFAVVSFIYRMTVLCFLVWLVWFILVPKGLGFLSIFVFATMAVGILFQFYRFSNCLLAEFFSDHPISMIRSLLFFVFLAAAACFAAFVPIPNSFRARGFLDFADKASVYATQTASLSFVASYDHELEKDQVVLKLDCPEKVLELQNLVDEITSVRLKHELLKQSAVNDSAASFELPSLLELSKELESRRNLLEPELNALVVIAPGNVFFIPAPTKIAQSLTPPNQVGFAKNLVDPSNLGCTVERGTLLGWFSSKSPVLIQTLVPESEIKSLRTGLSALCLMDADPSRSVECLIKKISPEPVAEIPPELLGDPMVVAVRGAKGGFQAETPHYLITLETQCRGAGELKGAIGSVHFRLESKTFAVRISDYLRFTFRPN